MVDALFAGAQDLWALRISRIIKSHLLPAQPRQRHFPHDFERGLLTSP